MRRGGRVPEIDLVRVVTFGAVIGVHAVGLSFAPLAVGGNAALMLLHYTRSAFFVLMAIVLVRSAERSGRTGKLRRRLTLVGVPYLVWSAIYLVVSWATGGRSRGSRRRSTSPATPAGNCSPTSQSGPRPAGAGTCRRCPAAR